MAYLFGFFLGVTFVNVMLILREGRLQREKILRQNQACIQKLEQLRQDKV